MAEGVGRRLKKLAAASQVLCVTHLAQIACFADHHYLVEKREQKGRTVATIAELDSANRTREIGRMLSGHKLTTEALKHAERLIEMSIKNRHSCLCTFQEQSLSRTGIHASLLCKSEQKGSQA